MRTRSQSREPRPPPPEGPPVVIEPLRIEYPFQEDPTVFKQLCVESGIARHLTVAGTSQQNGLAERMNKTLMDKVRCLLMSGLPKTFWAKATCTAAYRIIRSPSTTIEKKTPMKMWSGHPSDYEMLRIFGYVAYPHDKQGKLEPRAVEVELQRLNNHTLEEDQTDQEDGDDEDAGDQETNHTPDLIDYQLAQDREPRTRPKPLRQLLVKIVLNHPTGQKLVSCKWLFKIKEGIEGVQKPRYKVILALTAYKDYELEQLDVKTAFLHGNLEEVIYMRQTPGYEQDDMLIAFKSKAEIGSTKSLLKKEFNMKDLGEAKKILDNGKLVKMSLGGHFKLSLKELALLGFVIFERMSKFPYANAAVSLMYLMCAQATLTYGRMRYTSTTPIIDKIGNFEDLLISGQAILVDKAGNPLNRHDLPQEIHAIIAKTGFPSFEVAEKK
ncbi:retrotransposon protein, putative, ty1-copia subclass [Tanacetum coccineum]